MNQHADEQSDIEQEEARGARRRRIDAFLTQARGAQNDRDRRERQQLDEERKTWDETIEQIRELQQHEHDFDR